MMTPTPPKVVPTTTSTTRETTPMTTTTTLRPTTTQETTTELQTTSTTEETTTTTTTTEPTTTTRRTTTKRTTTPRPTTTVRTTTTKRTTTTTTTTTTKPTTKRTTTKATTTPKPTTTTPDPSDTRYSATAHFHAADLLKAASPVYPDGHVDPSDGPEGFGSAADFSANNEKPERSCLKMTDLGGSEEHQKCWKNPLNCKYGFSASIWAKINFRRKEDSRRYIISTGGDEIGIPGIAIYYKGIYLFVVVSTGENVWSIHAAGLVMNDTWSNVAFAWSQQEGLDLYINGKREAFVKYPDPIPPPPRQPMKPLQLTVGCRRIAKNKYEDFVQGMLDEFVTWQYKIPADNAKYFLGGFDPNKLCNPATHPLRCSTDPRSLLKKINKMNLTDIDIAMTTIMHVTEVARAVLKKRRKADGSASSSGSKAGATSDANNAGGDGDPNDKARRKGRRQKKTCTGKEIENDCDAGDGSSGKNVTPSDNRVDDKKGNGKREKGKISSSSENEEDEEDEDEEEEGEDYHDEYDLDRMRRANLKNMIAIVKKLVNKTSAPFNPGAESEDLGILMKMQDIVSTMFLDGQVDLWKELQSQGEDGMQLSLSVQQWAMSKLLETNTDDRNVDYLMISDSVASLSAKSKTGVLKKKNGPYLYFPDYAKGSSWKELRKKWNNPRDQLRVPTAIFDDSGTDASIQATLYESFHKIASKQNTITGGNSSEAFLDSRVITYEVGPSYNRKILLEDPVIVILDHYSEKTKDQRSHPTEMPPQDLKIEKWECVQWSQNLSIPGASTLGGWSTDSCQKINSTREYTTCACNSLGMFSLLAILEKPKEHEEPEDEMWVFAVKGLGYTLSIIALICYISAIAMRTSLHDQFHLIRLNLAIAAVGTMLSFFSIDFKRHDWEACRVLSGFVHYFYLAVGCWLTILTHALFQGFIRGIVEGRVRLYLLVGWGLPLVVVGIVVASSPNYGYDDRCMVGPTRVMRCYLACPMLLLGMSSLVWSTVICCNLSSPQIKRVEIIEELGCSTKMLFCVSVGFTVIWSVGFVALLELDTMNARGWRKLFQIFNSWLGLLIVLFLGLGSKHFRYAVFDKYVKYLNNLSFFQSNQVSPNTFEYSNGYRFDFKHYYYK